jgi:hypothetical protein
MKTLLWIAGLLNCAIGFSQIEAVITGPDSLYIGQNSEYFAHVAKFPNRFLSSDTINRASLNTGISADELTGIFTYDLWILPSACISMKNESLNSCGDERYSLAYTSQNWAIVPADPGEGKKGVGLTVGTNGIMVAERSGQTLISRLSYTVSITDWSHIAVVYRTDSLFLYLNGSLVRSMIIPDSDLRTVSSVLAGKYYSYSFKGNLDEFRLWDMALTSEEVDLIKDKKMLGAVFGLRYYSSFDRGKFERTSGDLGDPNMTVTGYCETISLKCSSWDFQSYSGSDFFTLKEFDVHNISYLWSTGSTNESISFTPVEGTNNIFVKIYNPGYTKNALFSIIDSISIIGRLTDSSHEEGLVAYYPFNGNARDESVFRNDGTVDGAHATTDLHGSTGKALLFDGMNDFVSLEGALPVADVFTISFLALSQNETGYSNILSDGGSNTSGNNFLINFHGNNIGIRADKNAALNYEDFGPVELQDLGLVNNWVHVVWIMTPSCSRIFVNGILKSTIYETGSNVGYHDDKSYIGVRNLLLAPENYFRGKLDEMKIYNREFSEAEVMSLYQSYDFDTACQLYGSTGTISEIDNSKISVFPNPATDYVVVETTELTEFGDDQIRIVNMSGNTVYSTSFSAYRNEINVPALQGQGLFILQVYSPNGIIKASKKVIFQ